MVDRRFIPAWAGNTRAIPRARWVGSVHPRVGGEHAEVSKVRGKVTGSSPRGRGTPYTGVGAGLDARFIPAWAGNTLAAR